MALRVAARLGLAPAANLARHLASNVPCVLVGGVDQAVADHVVSLLKNAGGSAAVEESSLPQPMLLCPEVLQRHRLTWFRSIVPVE
jgi:hypothetical protein